LRGEPETTREERGLDLDLAEGGGEGLGLQAFFQGPGGVDSGPGLDDEEERGIEAEGEQPRPIGRAPFARPFLGQAPQQRRGGSLVPRRMIAEAGESEGEGCRLIAIGRRSDLVQSCRGEPAPGRGIGSRLAPGLCRGSRKQGAGGAGPRSRVRCGGNGQRHGNLLKHANTLSQMLDETSAPCPACSLDARRKRSDGFALWNVVTHVTNSKIRSCFVLILNRGRSQEMVRGRWNSADSRHFHSANQESVSWETASARGLPCSSPN
jgi:hypothetical protein